MTKKHFVAFAEEIRSNQEHKLLTPTEATIVACVFINVAKRINPRFDSQRFLQAANIPHCEAFSTHIPR